MNITFEELNGILSAALTFYKITQSNDDEKKAAETLLNYIIKAKGRKFFIDEVPF